MKAAILDRTHDYKKYRHYAASAESGKNTYFKKAEEAGDEVTPAQELDGSYTGYFRDLDGHLWQLIWNKYTAAS